jgi:hypothetical protein
MSIKPAQRLAGVVGLGERTPEIHAAAAAARGSYRNVPQESGVVSVTTQHTHTYAPTEAAKT